MGLLSPWFLAGLAVLGLPVWLHLLRKFKRTPRPFSSLMFFERRIQSSTKHRRLRYLALLSARLALLCLLALAFANPFIYRRPDAISQRTLHVIALDKSFSMRTRGRMDSAKTVARHILGALPENARVQVMAFDSQVELLTPPSSDRAVARSAIESLQPGDGASSYGELSRTLRVLQQTTGLALHASIITDAQQTSMPASFTDLEPGAHTTEDVEMVGKPVPNRVVESVDAPARIFGSQAATVTVTVRAYNAAETVQKVWLVVDGRTLASKQVFTPASGSGTVQFDNVLLAYGVHRAELRLDSTDDLPNDDRFLFSMERLDPRRVLFLYPSGRTAQSFYYKSALEASSATGLLVQPSPLEHIADQNLAPYAYIVLHDPGSLDEPAAHKLADYVHNGGSVLIAVGPATIASGHVPLSGNTIDGTAATQGGGHVDKNAPAIAGWSGAENVEFVQAPHIAAGFGDRVLAQFADGSPLLFEHNSGEGRVLVLASTLDNSASDFPLHTSYLPFVVTTGAYLAGEHDSPSSVPVGMPIVLRQTREQGAAADVIGPDGRHALSLTEAARAMTYAPPEEGYYEIQRADGHRMLLAVHADRRESDLTPIPPETLALWRNAAQNGRPATDDQVAQKAVRWNLWRYFLIFVLIAAVVESMLADRYLPQEDRLHEIT